ncbi:MAG: DUF3656 domain-containing protein [Bacilli bacterium]
MKKPELLAPAGSMETLKAVIEAGCDAVYLGGYMFGARSFANNFSNEEIVTAINYAHLYGVKIYVTVNTLIYEDEIEICMEYIDFLHKSSVDAIIVQDFGILDLVRKTYPNLEIHASTQMHIHNLDGVKILEKLGIKRVVLAREMCIDTIKEIKKNTFIEIETFVHGALCVSYSGQCLMSSLIGNRSGNRGTCAGCCRQKYDLINNNKKVNSFEYLLSMKDLNTILEIDQLIESGIDSFKIEGRTKRTEYSYLVVKLYRKAIDNYFKIGKTLITNQDINDLKEIFNRDFTDGYILNSNNVINQFRPNHMGTLLGKVIKIDNKKIRIKLENNVNRLDGIRIIDKSLDFGLTLETIKVNNKFLEKAFKGDIIEVDIDNEIELGATVLKTTNYLQIKEINELLKMKTRKIPLTCKGVIDIDKNIKLIFDDGINVVEAISSYVVSKAINSQTTIQRVKEQVAKLGDTVYTISKFDFTFCDDFFIPIKIINDLRRELVFKLNEKRLYKIKYVKEKYEIELTDFPKTKNTNYLINKQDDYDKIKNNEVFKIFASKNVFKDNVDKRVVLRLNNVMEKYDKYDVALIGELGGVNNCQEFYTDSSFNVTNSYAVAFLHSLGSKMVTLSYELSFRQVDLIIKNYVRRYNKHPNLEVIVYGRELVMTSKFNLLEYYKIKDGYLLDRFKNQYPLMVEDGLLKIYNYRVRNLSNSNEYFEIGINNIRYNLLNNK